eukprot:27920_1
MSRFEQIQRLLVDGFIRNDSILLNINIPSDVIDVIFIFYFEIDIKEIGYNMMDKWDTFDTEISCSAMKIESGTKIVRKGLPACPNAFGSKIISSGIAIWRFQVDDDCWMFGIADATQVNKTIQSSYYEMIHSYAVGYYGMFAEKVVSNAYKYFQLRERWKDGDIICMALNYYDKTLSYSVNKRDFIIEFDNIDTSKTYKLAVSTGRQRSLQLLASTNIK